MRTIIELVTVLAFVGLLALLFATLRRRRTSKALEPAHLQAATTMKVPAIKAPARRDLAEDGEGKTVRAPTAASDAYEMHQRYAPVFEQTMAIHRYELARADAPAPRQDPAPDPATFDQQQYERALAAFPEEPRTQLGHAAPKQRLARGSYNAQQYAQYGVRPGPGQPAARQDKPILLKPRSPRR